MIKFVVCDDHETFRKRISDNINAVMIKNNLEYEIHEFENYDKNFDRLIKDGVSSKIYLLDIELPEKSGIDIARRIRKIDWNSIIIMITSHSELGYEALKAQIMLLDFISKFDDCDKNLKNVLKKAISQIDDKKVLHFESARISYRIYLDDIIYIVKDTIERKCIIKTTYGNVTINKTLQELQKELDRKFYMTHRSCLVNVQKISKIDFKKNIIYFHGGESVDLISRDRKRGLKDYVGMV